MTLEEDDEGAGGGGVFPRRFYDEAGHEVYEGRADAPDPRERFMDRPDAAPDTDFTRGVDLDG